MVLEEQVNTAGLTINKLNRACLQEITSQLDRYINNWEQFNNDDYSVLQNVADFFLLFIDSTFNIEIPNIFIEVYLEQPMNIHDDVKDEIYNVIKLWLNIEDPSSIHQNRLLTKYAEAWAICNKSYFEHYINTTCLY